MAANEFEKRVQMTLDELKLHPSEEVWQNVEKRIGEKKRKRRIIFFIIFSFLGLALGGYGLYNFSNKKNMTPEISDRKSNEIVQRTSNKEQGTRNIQKIQSKNNTTKTNGFHKMKINKNPGDNKTQQGKEITAISVQKNDTFLLKRKKHMVVTALRKNKKEQEKKPANDTTQQNISPDISFNTNQQNLPDTASQKNISTHVANEIAKNNSGDTASQTNKENKADLSMIQIGKTKKQKRVPEKLKWGLNFSAGSSIITQNRFSLKGGGNFDRGSYNAPGTVTGGGAGFVNAPASNRSSFAFKAGLALKKNLTKRSSLLVNVNYNYLTDKIRIGNRQNGSPQANTSINVSSYYNTIPLKTFTDRFHFVGIPINYDWRITRNPKHFISLDIGTSIVYLLSTNAVVYDTISSGIYYHNRDLFNKTHINFTSGLSYHSIGKRSFEWYIEPQFSFDVSKIFKTDLDIRKYFLYTGIGIGIFFENQ